MNLRRYQTFFYVLFFVLLAILYAFGLANAEEGEAVTAPPARLHPTFPLLDGKGENVLNSGQPVSPMQSCGACHDTAFIAEHSFHADLGLSELGQAGLRAWDLGPGYYGRWDPLTYRYLDEQDLSTPEWLMTLGARHVGGGPAVYSEDGRLLTDLAPAPGDWDWQASGVAEMNCFLCHLPNANNDARSAALAAGQFGVAATATLLDTGLVTPDGDNFVWNQDAFDAQGHLRPEFVTVQGPTSYNCGFCHGVTHQDVETALLLNDYTLSDYASLTTGQLFSPQRMDQSGLNLADKRSLGRSWDVHAERVFECTHCHYALNNPIYYQSNNQPEHLLFDPRRLDFGDYLQRPLHQFAKGSSVQSGLAAQFDDSLRRCESCHSIDKTHDWLPYKERHVAALSCESCHVPKLYAPALAYLDWTALTADGRPLAGYRGTEAMSLAQLDGATLLTGYEPILLPRLNDESGALMPFNLIASWYWVYGDPARPVPLADLQAAWFAADGRYHPDLLALFDANGDGRLDHHELHITTDAQVTAVADRLRGLGLDNPRIMGEALPFAISHNVARGDWLNRDCQSCHAEDSRLTQTFLLADRLPGGVMPTLLAEEKVAWAGELILTADGGLAFQPQPGAAQLYILGHSSVSWVSWTGAGVFLTIMAGIFLHGGARVVVARRNGTKQQHHSGPAERVYMYDFYERFWHWLQTAVILLLIFTGLVIHKPEMFGMFSFRYMVQLHNILAAILVINAVLAFFYHLVSGEIRQFLPRPRGFFDQAFEQTRYYLIGIFKGDPHPFAKSRQRKMNPMQQITYLMVLNVLLPLQIITGVLMWGASRWPELVDRIGGLPFLGPFHTLIAWLFAAFILLHVYLTTTGHTPTAHIKAMMLGWEESGGE
jgi:thiosulfate reductase cytochrome b subunit